MSWSASLGMPRNDGPRRQRAVPSLQLGPRERRLRETQRGRDLADHQQSPPSTMTPELDVESASGSPALRIDSAETVHQIAATIRRQVGAELRRRGVVVAMSGGIDSSVCAALAVQALGPERVFGLIMPERDSDPASF